MKGWRFPLYLHSTYWVWPVQSTAGFWGMTVDYYKLSQMVTVFAAAIPDVFLMPEQINIFPCTLLIWQMLFSPIPVKKDYQKQFSLSWKGQQYNFPIVFLV